MFFAFKFATGNRGHRLPGLRVILLALIFIYSFIMGNTTFGRHIYAVGGNRRAAALSGVNVARVNFLVIANMSMLAALAGMVYLARAGASGPADGVGWELDAIAAVFIGGAAVTGGVGTVIGSMIGGLVMAFLNNGLSLMGVEQSWVSVIKGLVLLAAVAFDLLSKQQGGISIPWPRRTKQAGSSRPRRSEAPARHGRSADPVTVRRPLHPTAATHSLHPYPTRRTMRKSLVAIAAACSSLLIMSGCSDGVQRRCRGAERLCVGSRRRPPPAQQATASASRFPSRPPRTGPWPSDLFEIGPQGRRLHTRRAVRRFGLLGRRIPAGERGQHAHPAGQGARHRCRERQQLTGQVETAESQGVPVIAYDRPIDAKGTDYYVAFDNFKVGQLQGQALLDGMGDLKGESPWNIELFAGAATDANAPVFFAGAMDVLQPKIDDGTLKVTSGQTSFDQVSTEGWKKAKAQERMENLITNYYSDGTELDGVLSPNDQLAEGILNAASAAKLTPVVTGQDSEVVAVARIAKGTQYSTIYKDTRKLVAQTVDMVKQICTGAVFPTTTTFETDSGVVIPTFYLEPLIVTKDNAAEVYADNEQLLNEFNSNS